MAIKKPWRNSDHGEKFRSRPKDEHREGAVHRLDQRPEPQEAVRSPVSGSGAGAPEEEEEGRWLDISDHQADELTVICARECGNEELLGQAILYKGWREDLKQKHFLDGEVAYEMEFVCPHCQLH